MVERLKLVIIFIFVVRVRFRKVYGGDRLGFWRKWFDFKVLFVLGERE